MNEEWYNDQVRLSSDDDWVGALYWFGSGGTDTLQRPNYELWLNQIVAEYQLRLDRKDRMFARFLLDLPSVPSDVFTLLRDLCAEPDRWAWLSLTGIYPLIGNMIHTRQDAGRFPNLARLCYTAANAPRGCNNHPFGINDTLRYGYPRSNTNNVANEGDVLF